MASAISVINDAESSNCTNNTIEELPKKKSKGHRCYFCGEKFMEVTKLRKHVSVHRDRDFFCEICGKSFLNTWGLKKHQRIVHSGERPFQCEYCGRAFAQKYTLELHIKSVCINPRSNTKFCVACGKPMRKNGFVHCWKCRYRPKRIGESSCHSTEQDNSSTLNSIDSQSCEINQALNAIEQEKNSEDSAYLDMQKSATGGISFSCGSCNVTYKDSIELKKHMEENCHSVSIFSCGHCSQTFKDLFTVEQHLATHSEHPHVCLVCGKGFETNHDLTCHMAIHKEHRPFACKVCKCSFSSKTGLTLHMFTHTEDRPFACKDCDKRFKTNTALKQHEMRHNCETPWSCQSCDKTFVHLSALQQHVKRVHSGEHPYKCIYCEKAFRHSKTLRNHEKTHQIPELYAEKLQCNICSKKFISYSVFKKHMMLHA